MLLNHFTDMQLLLNYKNNLIEFIVIKTKVNNNQDRRKQNKGDFFFTDLKVSKGYKKNVL